MTEEIMNTHGQEQQRMQMDVCGACRGELLAHSSHLRLDPAKCGWFLADSRYFDIVADGQPRGAHERSRHRAEGKVDGWAGPVALCDDVTAAPLTEGAGAAYLERYPSMARWLMLQISAHRWSFTGEIRGGLWSCCDLVSNRGGFG